MRELRIYADKRPWSRGIELFGVVPHHLTAPGVQAYVRDLVLTEQKDEALAIHPFASLSQADAEHLMTQLWRAGVRPSEDEAPKPQMSAMEAHIADLRKITFNLLRKDW